LSSATLKISEQARADKKHLSPKRTAATKSDANETAHHRNIVGMQSVSPWPENIYRLAIMRKDRNLAFAHNSLRSQPKLRRTARWNPMHQLITDWIGKLDNIQDHDGPNLACGAI
jgi:hypothetical protein